jgi:hypothetical protein
LFAPLPGTGSDGNHLAAVSLVTDVCPVWGGSGGSTLTGIRVQRQTVYLPVAWVPGDPTCETDPTGCCPASVTCCETTPDQICATVTGCEAAVDTTVTLNYSSDSGSWYGTSDDETVTVNVYCDDGAWVAEVTVTAGGAPCYTSLCTESSATCDPFAAELAGTFGTVLSGACTLAGCGGTDVTVSLAPCGVSPPSPPAAGCLACDLLGNTPTAVVPDGPYAGTYPAAGPWADLYGAANAGYVTINGAEYNPYCQAGTGIVYLGGLPGTVTTCGPPAVFTFPGATWGATGDVTVTT